MRVDQLGASCCSKMRLKSSVTGTWKLPEGSYSATWKAFGQVWFLGNGSVKGNGFGTELTEQPVQYGLLNGPPGLVPGVAPYMPGSVRAREIVFGMKLPCVRFRKPGWRVWKNMPKPPRIEVLPLPKTSSAKPTRGMNCVYLLLAP